MSSELRLVSSVSTEVSVVSRSGHGDSHPPYSRMSWMDGNGAIDGVIDWVEDSGIRVHQVVRYKEPFEVLTF